jgi:hypothetical protein
LLQAMHSAGVNSAVVAISFSVVAIRILHEFDTCTV